MLSEREFGEFKRGPLQMLVLFLLSQQDMYGYQIAQEIKARSGGKFTVSETAFYVVLYRLIDKEYISKQKEVGVKKARVFYHLEPTGREFLNDLLNAYQTMSDGVWDILNSTAQHSER
ncbi:MAG: helix-turn-helix transcriptional regulator [Acutalibacter sp.]|nr:helix-turn-helix transcriptional regulator [Acutalibacter sp.]